jgi:hypothetical protein
MELCQASFACWNFNVVPRFGPVAQESLVDSALLPFSGPSTRLLADKLYTNR